MKYLVASALEQSRECTRVREDLGLELFKQPLHVRSIRVCKRTLYGRLELGARLHIPSKDKNENASDKERKENSYFARHNRKD